jgi:predicted transcriptional regulator
MSTATVRIDSRTHKLLHEIKKISGEPMQIIISKALEHYKEVQFWNEVNEAYMKLRTDKKAWKEELNERKLWSRTLKDGQ